MQTSKTIYFTPILSVCYEMIPDMDVVLYKLRKLGKRFVKMHFLCFIADRLLHGYNFLCVLLINYLKYVLLYCIAYNNKCLEYNTLDKS